MFREYFGNNSQNNNNIMAKEYCKLQKCKVKAKQYYFQNIQS